MVAAGGIFLAAPATGAGWYSTVETGGIAVNTIRQCREAITNELSQMRYPEAGEVVIRVLTLLEIAETSTASSLAQSVAWELEELEISAAQEMAGEALLDAEDGRTICDTAWAKL